MNKKLLSGMIAGLLGGIAMKVVVRLVDRKSFGLSAETDARAANQLWRRMKRESLSRRQAEQIGAAMHYGFAAATGAAYLAGATQFPSLRAGRGAMFGAGLWLVGDELAMALAGLEDPRRTPMFSHVSALGAHVLYGVILDAWQ